MPARRWGARPSGGGGRATSSSWLSCGQGRGEAAVARVGRRGHGPPPWVLDESCRRCSSTPALDHRADRCPRAEHADARFRFSPPRGGGGAGEWEEGGPAAGRWQVGEVRGCELAGARIRHRVRRQCARPRPRAGRPVARALDPLVLRAFVGFHLLQAAAFVLVVFVVVWWLSMHASKGDAATLRVALCPARGLVRCPCGRAEPGSTVDYQQQTWEYQIRGMIKHGASLSGWILLASGIAALVVRRGPSRTASPSA